MHKLFLKKKMKILHAGVILEKKKQKNEKAAKLRDDEKRVERNLIHAQEKWEEEW